MTKIFDALDAKGDSCQCELLISTNIRNGNKTDGHSKKIEIYKMTASEAFWFLDTFPASKGPRSIHIIEKLTLSDGEHTYTSEGDSVELAASKIGLFVMDSNLMPKVIGN